MDGVALLAEAHTAGFQVHAEGERLIVRGPKRLAALAQHLLNHKAAILELLELFEERAAIIEYDGGLSRLDAEQLAWTCLLETLGKRDTDDTC
jgi:hypothetical protein